MSKLSLWQAIQMGSEHHSLVQAAKDARARDRQFVARDFDARAETLASTLTRNGWIMINDGLVVERVRKAKKTGGSR